MDLPNYSTTSPDIITSPVLVELERIGNNVSCIAEALQSTTKQDFKSSRAPTMNFSEHDISQRSKSLILLMSVDLLREQVDLSFSHSSFERFKRRVNQFFKLLESIGEYVPEFVKFNFYLSSWLRDSPELWIIWTRSKEEFKSYGETMGLIEEKILDREQKNELDSELYEMTHEGLSLVDEFILPVNDELEDYSDDNTRSAHGGSNITNIIPKSGQELVQSERSVLENKSAIMDSTADYEVHPGIVNDANEDTKVGHELPIIQSPQPQLQTNSPAVLKSNYNQYMIKENHKVRPTLRGVFYRDNTEIGKFSCRKYKNHTYFENTSSTDLHDKQKIVFNLEVRYPGEIRSESFFISDIIIDCSKNFNDLSYPLKIQYFGIPLEVWKSIKEMIQSNEDFRLLSIKESDSFDSNNYVWLVSANNPQLPTLSDIQIKAVHEFSKAGALPTSPGDIEKSLDPKNTRPVGLMKDYINKIKRRVRGIGSLKIQLENNNCKSEKSHYKLNVSLVDFTVTGLANAKIAPKK